MTTPEPSYDPWAKDPDPPDYMTTEEIKRMAEGLGRLFEKAIADGTAAD